jgi:hypothetical protein
MSETVTPFFSILAAYLDNFYSLIFVASGWHTISWPRVKICVVGDGMGEKIAC